MRMLLSLALVLALPLSAIAQSAPNDRERAALRRAQAALQQAQQARDALQAEKAGLEKARNDDQAQAARQLRDLAGLRQALAQAREALARQQVETAAELAAERQRSAQAQQSADAAARTRELALGEQLVASQRSADERRLANGALVQQLEQRMLALQDAERRVDELHALGMEALALYRDKGLVQQALQNDPVLGLGAVRLENTVELVRQRLDALRVPGPPPAPAPAPALVRQ